MLIFEQGTNNTWSEFQKDILFSERVFPKNIQTTSQEYLEILQGEKDGEQGIGLVLYSDRKYVGNIIGALLQDDEIKQSGIETPDHYKSIFYIFNFIVEAEFQGKGYGQQLINKFINFISEYYCEERNVAVDAIAGHFKKNGSLHIINKLGAVEVKQYNNW